MEVEKKHKKEDKHLDDAQRFVMLGSSKACTADELQQSMLAGYTGTL